MSDFDDHVIPYEEAVRRHREREEAQHPKGPIHEVKISDAMSHLIAEADVPDEKGRSPETLRRIVERELVGEGGRSGQKDVVLKVVKSEGESGAPESEPMGRLCSFKTRTCDDPPEPSEEPPRD